MHSFDSSLSEPGANDEERGAPDHPSGTLYLPWSYEERPITPGLVVKLLLETGRSLTIPVDPCDHKRVHDSWRTCEPPGTSLRVRVVAGADGLFSRADGCHEDHRRAGHRGEPGQRKPRIRQGHLRRAYLRDWRGLSRRARHRDPCRDRRLQGLADRSGPLPDRALVAAYVQRVAVPGWVDRVRRAQRYRDRPLGPQGPRVRSPRLRIARRALPRPCAGLPRNRRGHARGTGRLRSPGSRRGLHGRQDVAAAARQREDALGRGSPGHCPADGGRAKGGR